MRIASRMISEYAMSQLENNVKLLLSTAWRERPEVKCALGAKIGEVPTSTPINVGQLVANRVCRCCQQRVATELSSDRVPLCRECVRDLEV